MQISRDALTVSIPRPIYLVIEDVGWWEGRDGSADNQPFRNGFNRRHCLADYQALVRLATRLKMRLALGMVLGEWDRTNMLQQVVGATWMGKSWDNHSNQGPWLAEAGEYLNAHTDCLEIGVHGLCHEFWLDGRMERSEFHDSTGTMRARDIVRSHLDGFMMLLKENALQANPRLFLPPALNHSFGNGEESMQALLHEYGIEYVVTRFSRARRYAEPRFEKFTWECGVSLLERGISPVQWDSAACPPVWDFSNPILALHWSNLLHPEPAENGTVIDAWAEFLLAASAGIDLILVEDIETCRQQTISSELIQLRLRDDGIILDLSRIPADLSLVKPAVFIKIQSLQAVSVHCEGATVHACRNAQSGIQTVCLSPDAGRKRIEMRFH